MNPGDEPSKAPRHTTKAISSEGDRYMRFSSALNKRSGLLLATGLALCISSSMHLVAQQPKAVDGSSGKKLKKEIESMAGLQGQWSCGGVFPSSGKHIASEIVFAPDLENAWLLVRHDDTPPNMFHSSEYWGFDSGKKQFVAFVFDNFGGARKFTSSGWMNDELIWAGEASTTRPPTIERFVYKKDGPDQLMVNWEVKKGTADWRVGDSLTCKRR